MAFVLLRRVSLFRSITNSQLSSQFCKFSSSSKASKFLDHDNGHSVTNRLHLSPLFSETGKDDMKNCKIELVDDEMWHLSSGLADAWRGNKVDRPLERRSVNGDRDDDSDNGVFSSMDSNKENPNFDEIEDMRIRGNLFYKLDKDSKEYQEYKFDFHRKKSTSNDRDKKDRVEVTSKKDPSREIKKTKQSKKELLLGCNRRQTLIPQFHEVGDSWVGKKQRTPTFNQLTTPYHEPFCLDIYISKGSVRASIIHRATSKVVVVAHSISKDMKFDLGSTKNRSACAAVGEVLAQRALADDIHNVIYTPRKGDKLEGKLQIVLNSIIDGGVDVKLKLKQKKLRLTTQDQH